MNQLNNEKEFMEDESVDIIQVLERYLVNWKWFVLSLVLTVVLAGVYIKISQTTYSTTAKILVEDDKKGNSLSGELSILSDLNVFSSGSVLANEIEIIQSRKLLSRVVDTLDLQKTYLNTNLNFGTKSQLMFRKLPFKVNLLDSVYSEDFTLFITISEEQKVSFKYSVGDESGKETIHTDFGKKIKLPFATFTIDKGDTVMSGDFEMIYSSRDEIVTDLVKQLSIDASSNKDATTINISMEGVSPNKNERVIDELIHQYELDKVRDKNEVVEKTSKFINERISVISTELTNVDIRNLNFKEKNNLIDIEADAKASMDKEAQIEQKIIEAGIQVELAKFVNDYLDRNKADYEVLPSNLGFTDPSIAQLTDKYNELVLKREVMIVNSSVKNPLVRDIDSQIKSLRSSLKTSLYNTLKTSQMEMGTLREQQGKYKKQLSQFPTYEKDYKDIQRDQQIKEALYLYLLQKREENEIAGAANVSNSKIVDYAYTNPIPVAPKKSIILLAAILLGFLIPGGVLYVMGLLDNKVKNAKDIQAVGLPNLGTIPKNRDKNHVVAKENPLSPISEAFRILRTNLSLMRSSNEGAGGRLIYVTSTVAGEGKTFISINLAHSLSLLKKKVIIVGLDLRAPKVEKYLEIQRGSGVSNYLADNATDWHPFVHRAVVNENYDVLLAGPIPPNPSELLNNNRIKQLFDELRLEYDYVVVDTAPSSVVTDTILINEYADVTIYVTRAGMLDKRMLMIPKNLIQEKKLTNVGIVVNDVDLTKSEYGYTYTYGYGNKEKKGKFKFKR